MSAFKGQANALARNLCVIPCLPMPQQNRIFPNTAAVPEGFWKPGYAAAQEWGKVGYTAALMGMRMHAAFLVRAELSFRQLGLAGR